MTRDVSTESDHVLWLPVREAIDAVDADRMAMLPPTYATCLELFGSRTVEEALAAAETKDRTPILPQMQVDEQGGYLHLPERLVALGEAVHRARCRAVNPDWRGGSFGDRARCVLAPNPSIMTLDGTNTWVLREHGSARSVVVDPGPLDDAHLDAVVEQAGDVAVVLLTHGHLDHSEAAKAFAERVGCAGACPGPGPPARRGGAARRRRGRGRRPRAARRRHPRPHLGLAVASCCPAEGAVLTGDTVLGRGTTVVAHPDGRLGAYLDSLHRLHALAEAQEVHHVWPGHGPVIDDALGVLDFYLAHRKERLEQVRAALETLGRDASPRRRGRARLHRRRPRALGRCRALRARPARLPPPLSPAWSEPDLKPESCPDRAVVRAEVALRMTSGLPGAGSESDARCLDPRRRRPWSSPFPGLDHVCVTGPARHRARA